MYTEEGQKQIQETIAYYMRNAKIIREGLTAAGITVFGGVDAPYIWLKVPAGMDSWTFFDRLLDECHIVGTPGSGFGPSGEGVLPPDRVQHAGKDGTGGRAHPQLENLT